MASLLKRLPQQVVGTEHVGRILAASGSEAPAGEGRPDPTAVLSDGSGTLVEPLTNRELDVLELLDQRLRDKEIAEKLFVAPVTVKSHLKGLYRKLAVGGRREAVARARELGILSRG
jgi:LuxR family maltose regulon positive regulatory protein